MLHTSGLRPASWSEPEVSVVLPMPAADSPTNDVSPDEDQGNVWLQKLNLLNFKEHSKLK